jgi:acetyl/propionyl-CoA carboxylase alpha subunit
VRRLLVANRGEVARRVFRTCRLMGIGTVAVYSTADADSLHVGDADLAVALPGPPELAYLDAGAVVEAARRGGADAVHPGYGFLAEDAGFAAAVTAAGLVFVGPPPPVIAAMADKLEARRVAAGAGIEATPGGAVGEREWRYPVLVKAVAGGGGRGMVRVDRPADLAAAVEAASRQARSVFGDDRVYVEELIGGARHIEVQVLADAHGGVVHLHDRECSVQRRHQKVIEEAPAPGLDPELRDELAGAACRLAKAVGYAGVGTVEFLVDPDGSWWFLEMNTRLQVEHPVTEAVTGVDLVEQQIRIARDERLMSQADLPGPLGHAVEARLLAEDPTADDMPQSGTLHRFEIPVAPGVRVDTGVGAASTVGTHYDPLLAKVIAHRGSRGDAVDLLAATLVSARIHGVATNRDLLVRVLRHRDFVGGAVDTAWLERTGADLRVPLPGPDLIGPAAAAAALVLADRERRRRQVMPSIPAGFRNVPGDRHVTHLQYRAERLEVSYRLFPDVEAVVGDGRYAMSLVGDGSVDAEVDGVRRRFEVTVWSDVEPRQLTVDTVDGAVDLVQVSPSRAHATAVSAGSLTAPVPGRVVAVSVAPGAAVTVGETLVVVESMKLEHTVSAVEPGTVVEVAGVGDVVAAGQVVAVVAPG